MQEAWFTDFLFSQSLAEMDPFLLFLMSVSRVQVCFRVRCANLLLCALPLDGFLGVMRPWRSGMVGLDLEVFLLLGVCKSSQSYLASP